MRTTRVTRSVGLAGIVLRGALVGLLCWPALAGEAGANSRPHETTACQASLNRIFEAIQEYRRAHQAWPGFLSDLEPEFVADPRLFICPEVQRRGDYQSWRRGVDFGVFADPLLPTTYAYEFCAAKYRLWAGLSTTVQEYKLRQMQIVGSNVPIVRCLVHRPYLNLATGGFLYQSGKEWEDNFTNQVALERLLPHEAFKDLAPLPGRYTKGVPPREPGTDPQLLDLSPHFVVPLQRPWIWRNPRGIDLDGLPLGSMPLAGVPVRFDIRGLIQLGSRDMIAPFPAGIDGIRVRQKCRQLHLLEGAVVRDRKERPGTEIGHYLIHYADEQRARIPIIYGQDVVSAWDVRTEVTRSRVAWERKGGAGAPPAARVFHRAWTNPRPTSEIDSISFISAMANAAPFLIAITLEL